MNFKDLKEKSKNGLLRAKEVMSVIDVSRTTLVRWEAAGYLVPIRIGGRLRYKIEDVERIIKGE